MVVLHQLVDVLLAKEPSVHAELQFYEVEKIHVLDQVVNGFYIRNIARQFSVIPRQHGNFAKEECQIDLGKVISFFVLAIFHLLQQLRK